MKTIIFAASLLFCVNMYSQSFSTQVAVPTQTIMQGTSATTSYSLGVTASGGFSASVYFQLIAGQPLIPVLALSTATLNTPYTGAQVNVANTNSLGPGSYSFVVKSYNGSLIEYDTLKLVVAPNPCPTWFNYSAKNSVMTSTYALCVRTDKHDNFWGGGSNENSLFCFDHMNWYVWNQQGFKKYDLSGQLIASSSATIADYGINCISISGDTVYAASDANVYMVINKVLTVLPSPPITDGIRKVVMDHNGNLWAGSATRVCRLTPSGWTTFQFAATGAPFTIDQYHRISDFDVDWNGNLWFSYNASNTYSASLHRFDGTFWTTYDSSNGLTYNVTALACSPTGILYASSGAKLHRYDPAGNNFVVYASFYRGWAETITFDAMNRPVPSGPGSFFLPNNNGYTTYNETNSPVISQVGQAGAHMGAVDSHGNFMVADGDAGFVWHCASALPVGISERVSTDKEINLYPNPAEGKFFIEYAGADQSQLKIDVYNLLGQKLEATTELQNQRLVISVPNVANSICIVHVYAAGKLIGTRKVILR